MIVLDSSALLETLLRTPIGEAIQERFSDSEQTLHAPYLIDVELANVIRRYTAFGEIDPGRARAVLHDLAEFPLWRHPHLFLLQRVWELRNNLSAYDAVYVALAEALDATLLTHDQRLANAPGHDARVELV